MKEGRKEGIKRRLGPDGYTLPSLSFCSEALFDMVRFRRVVSVAESGSGWDR